jgi:hypothetical protein
MKRIRSTLAALATIPLAAVAASAIPAYAATGAAPAVSVVADVASGPFHIDVTASRTAGGAPDTATGVFTAKFTLGGITLFTLHGPVTCLDVRNGNVGLFYPITSSNPALLAQLHSGVFIYFASAKGALPARAGFLPVPIASTKSCAPGAALLPITSGTLTISG